MILANGADDVRAQLGMSAIENSLELVILFQKGVGLVNKKGWVILFHGSEQRRRRDTGSEQGPRAQGRQEYKQRRLSTPLLR